MTFCLKNYSKCVQKKSKRSEPDAQTLHRIEFKTTKCTCFELIYCLEETLDPSLNIYLHYLQFKLILHGLVACTLSYIYIKKKSTDIYSHLRGSSLCNKRHTWPLTLHECPISTFFTDTATYCVTMLHTPGEKKHSSRCRGDVCWCVIEIHWQAAEP